MSTRIIYSQGTQTGKTVAQAVNATLEAITMMRRLKLLLDAASSGGDWTSVAAELGGGLTNQQAQDLWTIISTATAAIDVAATAELARLDQG